MKTLIIFVALVVAVYGCHHDADCAGETCQVNEEPFCNHHHDNNNNHHHHGPTCDCRPVAARQVREHLPCSMDSDCAGMSCSHGDATCMPHHDDMRCECP